MPTRVRTKTDESPAFSRGRGDMPGERVSGIRDERPKLDSGSNAEGLRGGLGRHLPITSVVVESMEVLQ
jgi:hypothetical protein